jgi:hypothetical protein
MELKYKRKFEVRLRDLLGLLYEIRGRISGFAKETDVVEEI